MEKLFTPGSLKLMNMVVAFMLAVCKDVQSPMNDRLIFVLVAKLLQIFSCHVNCHAGLTDEPSFKQTVVKGLAIVSITVSVT